MFGNSRGSVSQCFCLEFLSTPEAFRSLTLYAQHPWEELCVSRIPILYPGIVPALCSSSTDPAASIRTAPDYLDFFPDLKP